MATKRKKCDHLLSAEFEAVSPFEYQCAECAKTGDEWVHLRKCAECGIVLCCDDSVNRHARAHFTDTQHPVIYSAEPNERWAWCYIHEQYMRY